MIIGGVIVIICATLIKIYDIAALKHTEIIAGFFLSLFTIVFVSLFTRPPKFERGEL
jgi:Na+/proline symporter